MQLPLAPDAPQGTGAQARPRQGAPLPRVRFAVAGSHEAE